VLNKLVPNNKLRLFVWLFLIIPTTCFVVATIAYFIVLFWPHDISNIAKVTLNNHTKHLLIAAHGVKDSPQNWGVPLQRIVNQSAPKDQQFINIDWRPYSNNPLICSVAARRIGESLAQQIADSNQIQSVHTIGHSCGAFLVYGLSQQIKQLNKTIKVQSTYLDPVSIYAGVFWDYGVNNFGRHADFSDAYIDTEDTVPGSNTALKHAISFDVTAIKYQQGRKISPHNWPPHFYIQAMTEGRLPLLNKNISRYSNLQKGTLYDFDKH
jgi:hypothetical protein